jgi:hypothetical protein
MAASLCCCSVILFLDLWCLLISIIHSLVKEMPQRNIRLQSVDDKTKYKDSLNTNLKMPQRYGMVVWTERPSTFEIHCWLAVGI